MLENKAKDLIELTKSDGDDVAVFRGAIAMIEQKCDAQTQLPGVEIVLWSGAKVFVDKPYKKILEILKGEDIDNEFE